MASSTEFLTAGPLRITRRRSVPSSAHCRTRKPNNTYYWWLDKNVDGMNWSVAPLGQWSWSIVSRSEEVVWCCDDFPTTVWSRARLSETSGSIKRSGKYDVSETYTYWSQSAPPTTKLAIHNYRSVARVGTDNYVNELIQVCKVWWPFRGYGNSSIIQLDVVCVAPWCHDVFENDNICDICFFPYGNHRSVRSLRVEQESGDFCEKTSSRQDLKSR